MNLRFLLILLTGLILPALPVLPAGAADDGKDTDAARAERARPTWNVRWTRHVLDKHFDASRFDLRRGDHFVVLHDTDPTRAAARVALLERTHRRFYRMLSAVPNLEPVGKPMVCVLFADRDDFVRYAERVDLIDMSWSGGYYSSRTNRMALYDATHGHHRPRRDATADHKTDASKRAAGDDAMRPNGTDTNSTTKPPLNMASTAHEAAHQLAFNSGLQRRGVMYPFWVSEGLACMFETNRAGEHFGLDKIPPVRLADLRRARRAGDLEQLGVFVRRTRPPTRNKDQLNAAYAQSWALFHMLFQTQPEALTDYLDQLAHAPRGWRSGPALRREFVRAFGPLSKLDRQWRQHLAELCATDE